MQKEAKAELGLKVALVHDWLTGMRGGEKVLEVFCRLFPDADLFTLLHNRGSITGPIVDRRIFTSFIDRLPFKKNRYRHYLPLFPAAIERFDFKPYDLILSTSHCVAKGVRTPPTALHISYLHTPMRYVWDMYEEYFGENQTGWLSGKLIPLFANYLRMWDVTSSNRVDYFLANSQHVASRIEKFYRREATVIYPPVDTDLYQPGQESGDFYLIVSALVPYKNVGLAIDVFRQNGKELVVIGDGPERKKLQQRASGNIRFLGWADTDTLHKYYSACRALIFPGEEDFGIVPVEVQACGKPVIALRRGGATETVVGYNGTNEGRCSGVFFDQQEQSQLDEAIRTAEKLSWNAAFIRRHAEKFSRARFETEIRQFIENKVKLHFGEQL